jgi:hypothetical protein
MAQLLMAAKLTTKVAFSTRMQVQVLPGKDATQAAPWATQNQIDTRITPA